MQSEHVFKKLNWDEGKFIIFILFLKLFEVKKFIFFKTF